MHAPKIRLGAWAWARCAVLRCTTESRQLCMLCMYTRWLRPLRWAAGARAYASGFGARGSVDAALGRCHVSTLHCARPLVSARSRGGHAGYALPAFQSRDWYRWDSIGRPRTSGPVRKESSDRVNDLPCVYLVWRGVRCVTGVRCMTGVRCQGSPSVLTVVRAASIGMSKVKRWTDRSSVRGLKL